MLAVRIYVAKQGVFSVADPEFFKGIGFYKKGGRVTLVKRGGGDYSLSDHQNM